MEKIDVIKIIDELWLKSKESIELDQFKEILTQWTPQANLSDSTNVIEIYTDGGCRSPQNEGTGIGGWGVYSPTPELEFKLCGKSDSTTNNIMELYAVKMALTHLFNPLVANGKWDTIRLFIDSSYTINTLSSWVWKWLKNGEIMEKKNNKLIREIADLIKLYKINEFTIQFIKVKGHSDCVGNIMADKLVNQAMDEDLNILPEISIKSVADTLKCYAYPEASIYVDELNNKIIIMDSGWSTNNSKFMYYTSLIQRISSLGFDLEVCGNIEKSNLIKVN